jgi:hypothetical protein
MNSQQSQVCSNLDSNISVFSASDAAFVTFIWALSIALPNMQFNRLAEGRSQRGRSIHDGFFGDFRSLLLDFDYCLDNLRKAKGLKLEMYINNPVQR